MRPYNQETLDKVLKFVNKYYQEHREKLSESFQPDKIEWLNKYDAILNEMSAMAEVEAFKFGFRLATAILLETTQ